MRNMHTSTITEQQGLLYEALAHLLEKEKKVALLDFPNHNNVGDNAIWLGEKTALKKMGIKVVYQCDIYSYSEKALRKCLAGRGVVLMHGGGNLGTIWPEHQRFREATLATLKDYRIIQLPQSVFFSDQTSKKRFGDIARSHPDYHVLLRDEKSFQILNELKLNVKLCPDMALALGLIPTRGKPIVDVVWLSRTDHESSKKGEQILPDVSTEKLDWLVGEPGVFYSKYLAKITVRIRRFVQKTYQNSSFLRNHLWNVNAAFFDLLAWSRFKRGVRILSRGKVVVTDRLHGHIISTLIGKPQVLLDNHYRKIGNYMDCFVSSSEWLVYLGDDAKELREKVHAAVESQKIKQ